VDHKITQILLGQCLSLTVARQNVAWKRSRNLRDMAAMDRKPPVSATTRNRLRRRYLEIIVALLLTAAAAATLIWTMQPTPGVTASLPQFRP
jgi:ferric-dicitrate binding protein FerR (iron transport regulator)